MITLQSIADAVGVSRATVSHAYNRPDQLSPELRSRILETAAALGYAGPDPLARKLRTGKIGAVGLVFTAELSAAFNQPDAVLFLKGVAESSELADKGLLLLPTPLHREPHTTALHQAAVDGFILYSVHDRHPAVETVLQRCLPTVIVDSPERGDKTLFLGIDDRGGARMAAQHLITLGHRRFAIIMLRLLADNHQGLVTPERRQRATGRVAHERLLGYSEALSSLGLSETEIPVYEVNADTPDAGYAATLALLDAPERPTALLIMTDQLAFGALRAARQRGLDVPDDLSVIGFDDLPQASQSDPPLSTIRQPMVEKGRIAVQQLFAHQPGKQSRIVLPIELVVRASTGPVPH